MISCHMCDVLAICVCNVLLRDNVKTLKWTRKTEEQGYKTTNKLKC